MEVCSGAYAMGWDHTTAPCHVRAVLLLRRFTLPGRAVSLPFTPFIFVNVKRPMAYISVQNPSRRLRHGSSFAVVVALDRRILAFGVLNKVYSQKLIADS